MSGPTTLSFNMRAQTDIRRITRELIDLQGQVASGARAHDLQGFGGASSRILNARGLMAAAEARSSVINQLQARFGVQGAALGRVAESSGLLSQAIRDAISAGDGRGIGIELELSFSSAVSALNQTWNGQPMFAGERHGAGPVKITTLAELQAATVPGDIFDEAARHQVVDIGNGPPVVVAAKASEMAQGLFDTMADLKDMLDLHGGAIGQPISESDRAALLAIAERLDVEANKFTNEEARAGQLEARFTDERVMLQQRSDLLVKEIGDQVDADLAQVSVRLSALLVQYEAAAKTFTDLSKLSLLKYL
mgnify:CR=1 FL=1